MADYKVEGELKLNSGNFISSANAASASLNNLNGAATQTGGAMERYLKRGAIAAATAITALAGAGIKAASDYQQAEIAFGTMLGSAEKATAFLQEMRDFAAKTPFELPDLLTGARRLMAMGFAAEEIKPMLTAVGDAAAGLGVGAEGVNRITLALGQMKAKGKVSGEEMRQLAEAGIPAWKYLAEATGMTTAEVMKLGEQGAIPAEQAIQVLIKGMSDGIGTARGFGGMMEMQANTMAGLMSTFKDTVRNAFVDGFQKYMPMIGETFTKLITLAEPAVNGVISFMALLIETVTNIAGAFGTVFAIPIKTIVLPAIKLFGGALVVVLTVIKEVMGFIKEQKTLFKVLGGIVTALAISYGALIVATKIQNVVYAIQNALAKKDIIMKGIQAAVTSKLTKAQRMLNLMMALNPIGLIVAGVTLLVAGFALLWKHSESFRKIVIAVGKAGITAFAFIIKMVGFLVTSLIKLATGPLRLVLKALDAMGVDAAGKALDGMNGMIESTGKFFTDSAERVEGFKAALDKLNKTEVKPVEEKIVKPKKKKKGEDIDLDLGGGKGDPKVVKAFKTQFDAITNQLKDANAALEDAIKSRQGAIAKFMDIMSEPFGTKSTLEKAISSGESTVDSIIGMYDTLVDGIENRFQGIKSAKKDELISYLTDQTAALVKLAGKREQAAKVLDAAQRNLEDVISRADEFRGSVTGSLKDFGLALADLSKSDAEATVNVIKTASGFMITQMSQGSKGVDSITAQLKDRLKTITEFSANIKKLLATGVNKAYVQQLLAAGPEAAGATASLLASAGVDQINEINGLYGEITSVSDSFGEEMRKSFYGNMISMSQAFVDGAKAEQDSIVAQMNTIRLAIQTELAPLTDLGKNLGEDLAAGLAKALKDKQEALVKQATALGVAVAGALEASLAATGLIKVATTSNPAVQPRSNNPNLVAPQFEASGGSTGDTIILQNGAVRIEVPVGFTAQQMQDLFTKAMVDSLKGRR